MTDGSSTLVHVKEYHWVRFLLWLERPHAPTLEVIVSIDFRLPSYLNTVQVHDSKSSDSSTGVYICYIVQRWTSAPAIPAGTVASVGTVTIGSLAFALLATRDSDARNVSAALQHLECTGSTLTVCSQYAHSTLTVRSQYTHSTLTVRSLSCICKKDIGPRDIGMAICPDLHSKRQCTCIGSISCVHMQSKGTDVHFTLSLCIKRNLKWPGGGGGGCHIVGVYLNFTVLEVSVALWIS